ncbi:MAG: hypothetical protein AAF684_10750, partial [Pseudomonadota bacterium]
IVQMDEISTAIAAAVEEQSAAANDISSNAGAVKNDMDEVVGDISDVLQGGYRTQAAAIEVIWAIDGLDDALGRMKGEVGDFLREVA